MDASIGVSYFPSIGFAYAPLVHSQAMSRTPPTDVWLRIQEAMRGSGRSSIQSSVAKMLAIAQPSVSEWATGKSRPKGSHYDEISAKTGYTVQWLRTGTGPKKTPPAGSEDEMLTELLGIWAKLSGDSRKALLQHAKLVRTIQITADPERVKEVHNELQEANHRFRAAKAPDRR